VIALLTLLVALLVVAVVALGFLQSRWALDSLTQAVVELVSRFLPLPAGGPGALRRRVARWSASCVMVMPSGAKTFPQVIIFRTSPDTAARIVSLGDAALLAHDLAVTVAAHARRERIAVHPDTEVFVILDPVMQYGWVSSHALSSEQMHDASAPIDVEVGAAPLASQRSARSTVEDRQARPDAQGITKPTTERQLTSALVTKPMPAQGFEPPTAGVANSVGMATQPVSAIKLSSSRGSRLLVDRSNKIGRDDTCTLTIDDLAVSRQHARIFLERGRYFVEDLGSSNGTTINGRHLQPALPVELNRGDVIRIGQSDLSWTVSAIQGREG
jgi:FHA domain-containing protein